MKTGLGVIFWFKIKQKLMVVNIEKYFKLDKPLIVFSLATTGLALSMDRIVKLSYIKIAVNGRKTETSYLFNPAMPIPGEATEIHSINDEMVKNQQNFTEKAKELWEVFNNSYYSGFNITQFDLPLLRREFIRAGLDFNYQPGDILDVRTIYNYLEPRNLADAYQNYCQTKFEIENDQEAGVRAALEVFVAQTKKYGQDVIKHIPAQGYADEPELSERKFYWQEGEPYFAFSRFKHLPVADVAKKNRGFLEWMLLADFSTRVKNTIKLALKRTKTE